MANEGTYEQWLIETTAAIATIDPVVQIGGVEARTGSRRRAIRAKADHRAGAGLRAEADLLGGARRVEAVVAGSPAAGRLIGARGAPTGRKVVPIVRLNSRTGLQDSRSIARAGMIGRPATARGTIARPVIAGQATTARVRTRRARIRSIARDRTRPAPAHTTARRTPPAPAHTTARDQMRQAHALTTARERTLLAHARTTARDPNSMIERATASGKIARHTAALIDPSVSGSPEEAAQSTGHTRRGRSQIARRANTESPTRLTRASCSVTTSSW